MPMGKGYGNILDPLQGVIRVNNKQRKQLLFQIRHIVECNGSAEVLDRVDYDLDLLYRKKRWNLFNV